MEIIEPADLGLDLDRLDTLLGFHLRMASATMQRHFANAMSNLELTQKQTGVLIIIGANPGVSQVELALTLRTDRATMMGIVDRLQARDLIVRKRSSEDRRKQELYLSDAGKQMRQNVEHVISAHEKHFTSVFSAPELGMMVDFLRRLYAAR